MRTPRYTQDDLARQPKGGYRDSKRTDISATFRRIRAEQARNAEEAKVKVKPLIKAKLA